jgi:serine protease Do
MMDGPKEDLPPQNRSDRAPGHPITIIVSTVSSLITVLVLLLVVRWLLPPLIESSRYAWHRGQLRAQNEAASEQLQHVSLDSLAHVSERVSWRTTPSVVHIEVKQAIDWMKPIHDSDGLHADGLKVNGQGSGVLIDSGGYILTNYHVLKDCEGIRVRFSDGSSDDARLLGIDVARDLAVIQVKPIDLPAITWGDSDQLTTGTPVWAVGSPFGLSGSVTFGIVSGKHRVDLSDTQHLSTPLKPHYSDLIQSDVAVNPGNSGGPLVDSHGNLVGINTAILGETFQGVSFSIPSKIVQKVYTDIREQSTYAKGWLGVRLSPTSMLSEAKADKVSTTGPAQGVTIVDYARFGASPARTAGLLRGDIIVAIDGVRIADREALVNRIGQLKPETAVRLSILRGSQPREFEVILGLRFVEIDAEATKLDN